jgi:hypothetical protein
MNKKNLKLMAATLSSAFLLAACATAPMGPSVQVMPGKNKSFDAFQQDQEQCKAYANSQVSGQVDAANKAAVGQAALGTLIGAAAGAAIGDNHYAAGGGAGAGLVAGTAVGANSTANAQMSIQQQYDNAYMQCMYLRHNQVPGMRELPVSAKPAATSYVAPPPPPPPGAAAPAGGWSIAQAQAKLNEIGYPCGRPDGKMGAKTVAAIKNFQRDSALPETGQLDGPTVEMLRK